MGNATSLTGDNGSITDTYAITPYGDIADHVGPTDNPFTWQGQYGVIQESKGLYFMRQRHYDASASRFLSPDPLTTPDPRSAEPYAYARGNPLFYVDPLGAVSWAQISACQGNASTFDVPDLTLSCGAALFTLLVHHIGVSWGSLEEFYADDSPLNASATSGSSSKPSNRDELRSCNKLPLSCDPSLVIGLTELVSQGLGNQVEVAAATLAAAQVVSNDGGSVVGVNGSAIVGENSSGVINHDGGSVINHDGGSVINHDGGSVINHDGGSVISNDGGSLISQDGAGLLSERGNGVVGVNGSAILGNAVDR
jgi:RHS repeat-associated protein